MPRKHGARAVAEARRRIARARGIPVSMVAKSMVEGRLSAKMVPIGPAVPGERVKQFGTSFGYAGGEPVEQMLKKLKKLGQRPAYRVGKGISRRGGRRRR